MTISTHQSFRLRIRTVRDLLPERKRLWRMMMEGCRYEQSLAPGRRTRGAALAGIDRLRRRRAGAARAPRADDAERQRARLLRRAGRGANRGAGRGRPGA